MLGSGRLPLPNLAWWPVEIRHPPGAPLHIEDSGRIRFHDRPHRMPHRTVDKTAGTAARSCRQLYRILQVLVQVGMRSIEHLLQASDGEWNGGGQVTRSPIPRGRFRNRKPCAAKKCLRMGRQVNQLADLHKPSLRRQSCPFALRQ